LEIPKSILGKISSIFDSGLIQGFSCCYSRNKHYSRDIMDSGSTLYKGQSVNHQQHLVEFQKSAPPYLSRSIDITRDLGASTWLRVLYL